MVGCRISFFCVAAGRDQRKHGAGPYNDKIQDKEP